MRNVHLSPRRLGHVNLWVSNLERSIVFYEGTCGLELVRRERDLKIAFHSNGNTHHDIGMVEISRGVDRYGRDGAVQISKDRGTAVGLNHLGWEMENEQELVEAFKRLQETKSPIRAVDHLISHSIYLADPDGNGHEFYADELLDWRTIYNLDREEEVTGLWDPLKLPPKAVRNYNVDPPIRRVEAAPIHPSHLTDVTFGTQRFGEMHRFLEGVVGLRGTDIPGLPTRCTMFAGAIGRPDLILREVAAGTPVGLSSFTLALADSSDYEQLSRKLTAAGSSPRVMTDERNRNVLAINDPDGFEVRFNSPSSTIAKHR
jgi:catechol 2,3-dioxygenase